tara:strand:+ start:414 stop:695 length:282 start_codon:yes stop_codon:yes gene_type:complete
MAVDNDDNYQKPPSMAKMLGNFVKSSATWIAHGAKIVDAEQYLERLTACKECPHLIKQKMRCGVCGCFIEAKARMKTATCPDKPSRWDKNENE